MRHNGGQSHFPARFQLHDVKNGNRRLAPTNGRKFLLTVAPVIHR